MSQERLTRQELSWLLAQEARGAAKALREGVSALKQPVGIKIETQPAPEVETNLDALDDAISRLSELQMGQQTKARRGRIDLAALACEVAPNARIAMEPGAGTEVFGEDAELRRMIHLLISQTNSSPADSESARPDITIRRDGEWVRVSVELGPDSSATAELERRWLSRMATRHGGRLELEGGTESIYLPADSSGEVVAELRRELEQAQQLGEAYARELAAAFSASDPGAELPPSQFPPDATSERLQVVIATASAMVRVLRGWLDGARVEVGEAADALGPEAELATKLRVRIGALQELLADLERIAACSLTEPARAVDVAAELKAAAGTAEARAARHGVTVELDAPAKLEVKARPAVLGLVVRSMLDHAIAATARDGSVQVRLERRALGFELSVADGGPVVPAASRDDLLHRRVDPSSLGRPEGLALMVAEAASSVLGGTLRLGENSAGRAELSLLI